MRQRAAPVGAARRPAVVHAARSATKRRRAEIHHRAQTIIVSRYAEKDFTLAALATEMEVPERTLQLVFAEAEASFREELHRTRMERATELVLATMKAPAVAPLVGYRYANHFARSFEELHGVSPSSLRKALISRRRYESKRGQSPPESERSLRALERRMEADAYRVRLVHAQLIAA